MTPKENTGLVVNKDFASVVFLLLSDIMQYVAYFHVRMGNFRDMACNAEQELSINYCHSQKKNKQTTTTYTYSNTTKKKKNNEKKINNNNDNNNNNNNRVVCQELLLITIVVSSDFFI